MGFLFSGTHCILLLNFSTAEPCYKEVQGFCYIQSGWISITKPSYNRVILVVPALSISLFCFYPDTTRNLT